MAVARSFPHDPKRSDAVVEYWSIGAFNTPTLHYSMAPGGQFSTRGRMSEPMFSAQWLGQLRRGNGQKTAEDSPSSLMKGIEKMARYVDSQATREQKALLKRRGGHSA